MVEDKCDWRVRRSVAGGEEECGWSVGDYAGCGYNWQ